MAISFEQNGGFIFKSEDETDRKDKDKNVMKKTKRKHIILTLQFKEHLFW